MWIKIGGEKGEKERKREGEENQRSETERGRGGDNIDGAQR